MHLSHGPLTQAHAELRAYAQSAYGKIGFESTHTICPHPTVTHDITIMAQTRKIQLADLREGERDLPIEVLIGGDHYCRIIKDASTIRLSTSLVLLPTKFRWILTGNRTGIIANEIMVNYINLGHLDNDL